MKGMLTMGNPQETDIAWLAGVLDGEGYVSICMNQHKTGRCKVQFAPRVSLGITSLEVIEKARRILDSLEVGYLVKDRRLKSGKMFISIVIAGMKRVGKLLPFLIPHLTLKGHNARRILKFIELRFSHASNIPYSEEELALVQQCKTGPSTTTREAPAYAG
jgi:LAGLIDADG-like domain